MVCRRFVFGDPFLANVRRICHHDIEAALREDFREGGRPVERLRMHGGIMDDAVPLADGVIKTGEGFAARGGLDPEAELADLDGLGIEVYAVEIVLEDLSIEIEEGAVAAQFFETRV